MQSQSDWTKINGMRDLAGNTSSLKLIRDSWNNAIDSGKIENINKIAISCNVIGPKPEFLGDIIVSRNSQTGGSGNNKFKGFDQRGFHKSEVDFGN